MNKQLTLFLTACILLLASTARGQIVNGTFDVNNPGSGWYCGAPYGWISSNMTGSDIQWENQWNNDGDTWWVDLTGCSWGNGHWLEQTVATEPGKIYTLSFDLGCWNGQYYTNAGANVYINGSWFGHFSHEDFSGKSLNWKTFEFCFEAYEKSTTIRFEGDGAASPATPSWCTPISNYVGVIGLDNVALEKADAEIFLDGYCVPQLLTHQSAGGTAYWFQNGTFAGLGDSFYAKEPGKYTLVYDTPCGTVEDEVELVDCKDTCKMYGDFSFESVNWEHPEILCAGDYIIFTGFSTGGIALQYNWDFGGGQMGWSNSPTYWYKFPAPGVYNVCLTVWLKPGEIIPLCRPYTICKTITVVNCDPQNPDGGDGGGTSLPDDPGDGDQKSGTMTMSYPMLELFPNPANDRVTVTGLTEIDAEAHLMLYNIAGKLVYEETVPANQHETTFPVKELKAGVYLLRVQGREFTQELKLVKE